MSVGVRMRFVGAGAWDGEDTVPGEVPIQRVPCIGEVIAWVDTGERWRVTDVIFDYDDGFAYAPTVGVVCTRAVP